MAQENSSGIKTTGSYKPNYAQVETIQLDHGIARLMTGEIAIRMIEGIGWITRNNEDIFVYPEQEVVLNKSKFPVLISSLCRKQRIVFEVNQR